MWRKYATVIELQKSSKGMRLPGELGVRVDLLGKGANRERPVKSGFFGK